MTASREWLSRMLTPVARPLERVHPNLISCVSLLCAVAAGVAYAATGTSSWLYLLGGVLVGVSGLLDGLDGVVARLHQRTSSFGDFLDHYFDRLADVAILVGLALAPAGHLPLGLVATLLVVLNSYLGTQIHASFGTRHYSGLGKAQLFIGLVLLSAAMSVLPEARWQVAGFEISLVTAFFCLVALMCLHATQHRLRLAYRLAREVDGRSAHPPDSN